MKFREIVKRRYELLEQLHRAFPAYTYEDIESVPLEELELLVAYSVHKSGPQHAEAHINANKKELPALASMMYEANRTACHNCGMDMPAMEIQMVDRGGYCISCAPKTNGEIVQRKAKLIKELRESNPRYEAYDLEGCHLGELEFLIIFDSINWEGDSHGPN